MKYPTTTDNNSVDMARSEIEPDGCAIDKYPFLVGTDFSNCRFIDKSEEVRLYSELVYFLSMKQTSTCLSVPFSSESAQIIDRCVIADVPCERHQRGVVQEASMFSDASESHSYEVRGHSYGTDSVKLYTGPGIFRFLVADKIRVGEEYDLLVEHRSYAPNCVLY